MENAGGNDFGVPPQIIPASPCNRISRPSVTITAFSGGPPSTNRITPRSTTTPSSTPAASATKKPAQYGPVVAITLVAMNVVTISIPPCAKFTILVARQIITSDSATAA